MKLSVKAETFIHSPGRFFHYELLFTSSFSKNLIIPEAAMVSKSYTLLRASAYTLAPGHNLCLKNGEVK
jgi:hypothetical protein